MSKKYTELTKKEEERALEIHKKAIAINGLSLFRHVGDVSVPGRKKRKKNYKGAQWRPEAYSKHTILVE